MRKALGIALFIAFGVLMHLHFQQDPEHDAARDPPARFAADPETLQPERSDPPTADTIAVFNCDGRTHCSQMASCREATWFIQHCPGTEMDGDRDGIPCETQWCGHVSSK